MCHIKYSLKINYSFLLFLPRLQSASLFCVPSGCAMLRHLISTVVCCAQKETFFSFISYLLLHILFIYILSTDNRKIGLCGGAVWVWWYCFLGIFITLHNLLRLHRSQDYLPLISLLDKHQCLGNKLKNRANSVLRLCVHV